MPSLHSGTEIVLVRHGQTDWNASRRFLGRSDVPLDVVGRSQARALVDVPMLREVVAVYSSPLSRALETARALSSAPVVMKDLAELDQGELEGLEAAEALPRFEAFFRAWTVDPTGVPVPGGESLDACLDRALAALREVAQTHAPPARVAVVTHQMVIASVCCHVAGQPLSAWRRYAVPNTGWRRVLVASDGALRLLEDEAVRR